MRVRPAEIRDRNEWLRMRQNLWSNAGSEHEIEIATYLEGRSPFIGQVFVCELDDGGLIGFIELRIRNYAEGSHQTKVPFVEGWFVEQANRGSGAGRLLMQAAENWARGLGYLELASDAEIENENSIRAHLSLGFKEVERAVSFLKKL